MVGHTLIGLSVPRVILGRDHGRPAARACGCRLPPAAVRQGRSSVTPLLPVLGSPSVFSGVHTSAPVLGLPVFSHGLGGSQDLPIPLSLALAGGAAALAVSFTVLALAWTSPRFDADVQGRPVPGLQRVVDSAPYRWGLRLTGLAATAYVAWAAVAGPDNLANPTFGVVYVVLWVGLVPASLLLGPVYRAVNPVRTLHLLLARSTGGDPDVGAVTLPQRVGLWPAALGLFAFVWLELVLPTNNFLGPVRLWFAAYAALLFIGAGVFGSRWIACADPFEAYSTLIGRLSPWGRTADGTLVVRGPLRNLDSTPAATGLVAVLAVLIGSTAWDSFSDSLAWARFEVGLPDHPVLIDTLALLGFCLAVAATFSLATLAARPGPGVARGSLPTGLAHSLVPIVAGYVLAHYLTYLLEVGQQTLIRLSDPMVDGSNYLGTADWSVQYWLSNHPTLLACLKVGFIVGGHVLGVVAVHDRALRLLPRRDPLTGQLPLLVVMVGYTLGGLYLLLSV